MLFSNAIADDVRVLHEEELISDIHLNPKEFAYYHLKVTSRIYKGEDHLTISAFATSFNSDPDIYISRSQIATKDSEADQYCQKDGSDTCILQRGTFEIGENIYITVFCMQECTFDLRAYYAPEIELIGEKYRTNLRWGGHSTAILKYFIPKLSGEGGYTDSYNIKIEPEKRYTMVDTYVSHDETFNIIEDVPAKHILADGVSLLMNEGEPHWCVECYVYLIVVMVDDMRLYVTADATTRTQTLSKGIEMDIMVNESTFKCFQYSIDRLIHDVMFTFNHLQGSSDLFIARRNEPSTTRSTAIKMSTPIQHPKQVFVVTTLDREQWNAQIGQYYICALTYAVVSAEAVVDEDEWLGVYDAHKEHQYNFLLQRQSALQFVIDQDELFSDRCTLEIEATVWTTEQGDLSKLKIYYTVCLQESKSEPCKIPEEDYNILVGDASAPSSAEQLDLTETVEVSGDLSQADVTTSLRYKGTIEHDPGLCSNAEVCRYVFAVFNPSPQWTPRKATFLVTEIITEGTQDVEPGKGYRNTIQMGQYLYYRILDSRYDLEYIDELEFDLVSYLGDADIFISTNPDIRRPSLDNYDYQSRNLHYRDQITIKDTVHSAMSDYIYIAIYGNTFSEYELWINVKHHPHFNERLEYATPLRERTPVRILFENEWAQVFASYSPWWSMHESRTVVFLAESYVNDVTFYFAVDDYPLIYMSEGLIAQNEMYSLAPEHRAYTFGSGHYGTYYLRIRPAYALSDLAVDDPYYFDFHCFSQPAGNGITDLYAGTELIGVAWEGQNTYYRHFLTDVKHTVQITLTRLPRKGYPKLMVKFKNSVMLPISWQANTYDQKLETGEYEEFVQMWLHKETRAREDPDCDYAGYYIEGGREYCGIYIGVECGPDDPMCAFRISLELLEWTEDFSVFQDADATSQRIPVYPLPPRYIPRDQDYVDGVVRYNEDMVFYYPVVPEETGDVLVLVNKTAPLHQNGDLSLGMNVQADAGVPYTDWALPTGRRNTARSRTFDPVQPEIINMEKDKLERACGETRNDCAVLINIRGESDGYDSSFRIKVFNGTNRLYPDEPREDALLEEGSFRYYWFISTAAMAASRAHPNWLHEIGLGIKTPGQDLDMYVSVMDGRYPTEDDYDYKSENYGSDWITISNNDTLMSNDNDHSWNPRVGMVVVVGVRARFNGASAYSLMLKGPEKSYYDMHTLFTNDYEQVELPTDASRDKHSPYLKVYKWYNWQHGDFKLNVKLTKGAADFYLNKIGETNYEENAITGIPLSFENSQWYSRLNKTANIWSDEVTVLKIDTEGYPQFCYNCWYYLTVNVTVPESTEFRVFFQELRDSGSDYQTLDPGFTTEINIEEQGERKYARFMLDSKDSFDIELSNRRGFILVHISLDPDAVDFNPIWSKQFGNEETKIEIAKDDPRFHMATWYYISIQSLKGSSQSSIRIIQDRSVTLLANGYGQKFQFLSKHELVKFMVFEVPSVWSFDFTTTIEVLPLGDYVYPAIYLKKIELNDEPENFKDLKYPTIVDYDLKFGDNFSYQLYNNNAVYEFSGRTRLERTYYTVAVYSNIYGMTDMRKPNFKLTVTSVQIEDPRVDYLFPDEEYRPRMPDMEKVKHYVNVDPTGVEMSANERDSLLPDPVIMRPPAEKRKVETMDDVSDFPIQPEVALAESRPYEEGKYRPPSMPVYAGIFPTHMFLARGKSYDWCSCGHTQISPLCDGQCKWVLTRLRPITFNVAESGYYKLCNCKMSSNAPFCNGTHQHIWKWANKNHRGFWSIWGVATFWVSWGYWMFTFYK